MRFSHIYTSREQRYSLERQVATGDPVLSIPVANSKIEYVEWYRISEEELGRFLADGAAAKAFADECGARDHDDRLIFPPGSDRGEY